MPVGGIRSSQGWGPQKSQRSWGAPCPAGGSREAAPQAGQRPGPTPHPSDAHHLAVGSLILPRPPAMGQVGFPASGWPWPHGPSLESGVCAGPGHPPPGLPCSSHGGWQVGDAGWGSAQEAAVLQWVPTLPPCGALPALVAPWQCIIVSLWYQVTTKFVSQLPYILCNIVTHPITEHFACFFCHLP